MFNTLQKNNDLQGIANESRINISQKNCLFNYASLPMQFTVYILNSLNRFPKLLADPDWKHYYSQHHY